MKDGSAFSLTVRIVTPALGEGGGWRENSGVPFNLTYSDVMKRVAAVLEADGLDATITPADVWSVVPGVITEPGVRAAGGLRPGPCGCIEGARHHPKCPEYRP